MPDVPDGGETDMNMLLSMLDQNNAEALTQAQLLDNNLLNGLPPTFDFDAWSEYFGRFDFANLPQPQNGTSIFNTTNNNNNAYNPLGQEYKYASS
jgi:hypothetical protein